MKMMDLKLEHTHTHNLITIIFVIVDTMKNEQKVSKQFVFIHLKRDREKDIERVELNYFI